MESSQFPSSVFIIRHCDKDSKSGNMCSADGYKRALRIAGATGGTCTWVENKCNLTCDDLEFGSVGYFPPLLGSFPIFLAPISKSDKSSKDLSCAHFSGSNRCCLILNPLAKRYNTIINPHGELFADTQPAQTAQLVLSHPELYGGRQVVIAYEHKAIPMLINAFGVKPALMEWPKEASDRFDLVFKITFPNGVATLESIESQGVLKEDSTAIPDFHGTNPPFNPDPNAANCAAIIDSTTEAYVATGTPVHKSCGIWYYCIGAIIAILVLIFLVLYFMR